jgi:hypothetical protein
LYTSINCANIQAREEYFAHNNIKQHVVEASTILRVQFSPFFRARGSVQLRLAHKNRQARRGNAAERSINDRLQRSPDLYGPSQGRCPAVVGAFPGL